MCDDDCPWLWLSWFQQFTDSLWSQIAIYSSVKSLENLPLEVCDDPLQTAEELARKIFANSIVSDLLIRTSRLDVFSKDLAKSFSDDLESLLMVRKLKYFYNQPTGAILQQLAGLLQRFVKKSIFFLPLCRENSCSLISKLYWTRQKNNAKVQEWWEKFDNQHKHRSSLLVAL